MGEQLITIYNLHFTLYYILHINIYHSEEKMPKKNIIILLALLLICSFTTVAVQDTSAKKPIPVPEALAITLHTIQLNGEKIPYTATAGCLLVRKPDEKPGANMFFVAYTRDDVKDRSMRPLTFVFNGGPGSSSVWLHLGGMGPRRVLMTDQGFSVKPPFGLVDNEYSLLDITDLVFIDPVSTGYSRPLPGEKKSQFHGINEDLASVGEFIRNYVTKYQRWASPKFILGESYGTTRAAGLSGFLQGRRTGMYLNGIILVSSVLDFQTIVFSPGNNLPYILFLPHYTATAWFHKKLTPDLQKKSLTEVIGESEDFALGEYATALLKGNRLDSQKKNEIIRKLARFSGLSSKYIEQTNLRIRHDRFVKELLRDEFRTVGRLDSRFKGRDADAAGEHYEFDPSSAAIQGSFSTMLNYYLRTELKYKSKLPYAIYGNVHPWNWNYGEGGMRSMGLNIGEILRKAMSENQFLNVFVANGYYDGATPYFGTEYTFSQIGLNSEFKDRVSMGYYEAGHMMYIHKASQAKLKKDLTNFILSASIKKNK